MSVIIISSVACALIGFATGASLSRKALEQLTNDLHTQRRIIRLAVVAGDLGTLAKLTKDWES